MLLFVILSFYYGSICLFAFVKNSVFYCMLLMTKALACLSLMASVVGFSWYAALMYMVYVGGVYILFIFISLCVPKKMGAKVMNIKDTVMFLFFTKEMVKSFISFGLSVKEKSFSLCSNVEGFSYLFLCLFLLVSFLLVSLLNSKKSDFSR